MAKMKVNPLFLLLTFTFLFILGLSFIFSAPPSTKAAADATLTGYAWSSNIGWISLSCENEGSNYCDTSDYQVSIDFTSGDFSGYAWSSNIGWIDFDAAGPYPESPANAAVLIGGVPEAICESEREVSGWARALSPNADGRSGWDGWIKFAGETTGGAHYGVCLAQNEKSLEGYAWGGDVVGWVQFDPSLNSVLKTTGIREEIPR